MSARPDGTTPVPAEVTLAALDQLLDLGRSVVPIVVDPGAENWWAGSAGLFMRTLTLGVTTVHVSALRRPGDLSILVRCLYEHAVVLAWLAGPRDDSRWELWNRDSLRLARAWGNEMTTLGEGGFGESTKRWLDEELSTPAPKNMPSVLACANAADADWHDRLGLTGLNTLTASYTNVYRGGSSHAHPSAMGLFEVRQPAGEHVVFAMEAEGDIGPVIGPAFTCLAVALVVASHTFGRPDHQAIRAAVARLAGEVAAVQEGLGEVPRLRRHGARSRPPTPNFIAPAAAACIVLLDLRPHLRSRKRK